MMRLPRFPVAPPADVLRKALEDAGAAVIEAAAPPPVVDRVAAQCARWFARTPPGEGAFFGRRTQRFGGVLAKAPDVAALVTAPGIFPVVEAYLRAPDGPDRPARADCIQLNLIQAISIGPGEAAQILHRDDALFPLAPGFELMANVMWALDPFTAANGATRVVPGSHRWPRDRTPVAAEIEEATIPIGAALVWLGATLHGGGANRTSASRRGVTISYNLGWLAQTEKLLLTVPPDVARTLPVAVQRLLGYQIHRPNLGWIEGRDPLEWLRGEVGPTAATRDNLTPDQEMAVASSRRHSGDTAG